MPRTLRRHVQEAEQIWAVGGVRTLIPKKEPPAPIRVSISNEQLVYAVSIRLVVEKCDRTGWAARYLKASDEACSDVWRSIPEYIRGAVSADLRSMCKRLEEGGIPVRRGRK